MKEISFKQLANGKVSLKNKIDIKTALLWNVNLQIVSQILTFGMSIMLARILMPKDFGIMAIGMILVNYVNTFTDFGFTNALIQKENITREHINSVFCINFTLSSILTLACFFGAPFAAILFNSKEAESVIRVLSVVFLLTSFSSMYEAYFRRELKYKFISTVAIFTNICTYGVGIALALMGFSYWALVISNIAGRCFKIMIYIVWCRWIPLLIYSHKHMKYIFNFGMWNFLRSQLYFLNRYFLHIIVASNLSTAFLGIFDKAYEISNRPSAILGKKVNGVMMSGFSRLQNDTNGLQNWFLNLLIIQIMFFMPVYAGLYVIAPYFITALLGEKWILAIEPMKILCITFFFMTCGGGYASFNIGVGNYKQETIRDLFISFSIVTLSIPFTIFWGLTGACYAICIVAFMGVLLSFYLIKKRIKIKIYSTVKQLSLYMLNNIFMLAIVLFCSQIFPAKNIVNLIIITSAGFFSYAFFVIISNTIYGRPLLFPVKSK